MNDSHKRSEFSRKKQEKPLFGCINGSICTSFGSSSGPSEPEPVSFASPYGNSVDRHHGTVWIDTIAIVWTDTIAIVWIDTIAIVWIDTIAIVWIDTIAIVLIDTIAIVWIDTIVIVLIDTIAIVWTGGMGWVCQASHGRMATAALPCSVFRRRIASFVIHDCFRLHFFA